MDYGRNSRAIQENMTPLIQSADFLPKTPKITRRSDSIFQTRTHISYDCTFDMKDCPSQFRGEYIEGPT